MKEVVNEERKGSFKKQKEEQINTLHYRKRLALRKWNHV